MTLPKTLAKQAGFAIVIAFRLCKISVLMLMLSNQSPARAAGVCPVDDVDMYPLEEMLGGIPCLDTLEFACTEEVHYYSALGYGLGLLTSKRMTPDNDLVACVETYIDNFGRLEPAMGKTLFRAGLARGRTGQPPDTLPIDKRFMLSPGGEKFLSLRGRIMGYINENRTR